MPADGTGLARAFQLPGAKRSICMLTCMILPLLRTTTGRRMPSVRSWSGARTGCSATPKRVPKPARSSTPLPPPPVPTGSLWRAISPGCLPRGTSSCLGIPTNKNDNSTIHRFLPPSGGFLFLGGHGRVGRLRRKNCCFYPKDDSKFVDFLH